jgi:hypothetical protein
LLWELEFKEKEFSMLARIEKGQSLPDWVEDEPIISPGDEFILSAFYHLSSCRHFGGEVPGPIPWNHVIRYAEQAGLDEENTKFLVFILREMDAAYLKWYGKQVKMKLNPPKAPTAFRRTRGSHGGL